MSKELDGLKVGSTIEVYLDKIESYKGEIIVSKRKLEEWGHGKECRNHLKIKKRFKE